MKRFICLFLAIILLFPVVSAIAEIFNFSELSYAQLLELRKELDKEILSRPEWKEVTVPAGRYTVGEDIPEGSYSIQLPEGGKYENFRGFTRKCG